MLFVIIGLAFTVMLIGTVLKESKMPAFAVLTSLVGGVVVLLMLLPKIQQTLQVMSTLAQRAGLNALYLEIVLKIIAISYLAEFAGQICRDAGAGAMATKVDMAAKVLVMILGLPIMVAILDTVLKILP